MTRPILPIIFQQQYNIDDIVFLPWPGERSGRLAGDFPKKFGEGASGAPAIYAHYAI